MRHSTKTASWKMQELAPTGAWLSHVNESETNNVTRHLTRLYIFGGLGAAARVLLFARD